MITLNKRFLGIILCVMLLLLIPFIAMQFTNEVSWTLMDFVIAGALLLATGFSCDLVIRSVRNKNLRIVIVVAIIAVLILVWGELAVGILGTPFAGS